MTVTKSGFFKKILPIMISIYCKFESVQADENYFLSMYTGIILKLQHIIYNTTQL